MPQLRRPVALVAGLSLLAGGLTAFTAAPAAAVPGADSTVFVNEIHYDNTGTDAGEFVEIANTTGSDLTGWSLVLYNGGTGASYDTDPLSGTGELVTVTYPVNGIQNGFPDGLALVDPAGAVVQFLSYEGPMTATAGPANGMTSTDIGVSEAGTEPVGQSLQLTGTGSTYGDFTWAGPEDDSPGAVNTGQTFGGGGEPSALAATDPADVTATQGQAISPINLQASGGTVPYTWDVSGLPAGLTEAREGVIEGTPTQVGVFNVTVTVTDSATPAASDTEQFTITVNAPAQYSIAEIQGTGSSSPKSGQTVTTEGIVTAVYDTGGLNGFVIQTEGSTPGPASHGLFVYTFNGARAGLVAPDDEVQVTGRVSEFRGLTQITAATDSAITKVGTGTITAAALGWPETDTGRESLESMLLMPTGDFTVTDNYSLNRYAEIGLAAADEPLRQPTDVGMPGSPEAAAEITRNDALAVTLDDGASIDFLPLGGGDNQDIPLPWLTDDRTIRIGDPATFTEPVVLSYGFGKWRFQPVEQLIAGDPAGVTPATFGETRPAAPEPVGGGVQVASFNVLNYFSTTGKEWVADGNGTCSFYVDRDGDPVTSNRCDPDGPRGAAEDEDLERQQAKIVGAINALGAEVVSLEEIENSAQFGRDRDAAMADLVRALNAAAGAGTWAYVPSPSAVPTTEDVIRNGFIYRPAVIVPQGESVIHDGPEFDNARDPLAQVFKPKAGNSEDKFVLIVNHFKSKGSPCQGEPSGPQGNCNETRVAQAEGLVAFAEQMKAATNVEKVYLNGDLNSYTYEDPMQVLYEAGYASLGERYNAQPSYLFRGLVGSLDHALANDAALGATTGATVWTINAFEPIALEYSRHNYNATDFYDESVYRSSDHNPVMFGVDVTKE